MSLRLAAAEIASYYAYDAYAQYPLCLYDPGGAFIFKFESYGGDKVNTLVSAA